MGKDKKTVGPSRKWSARMDPATIAVVTLGFFIIATLFDLSEKLYFMAAATRLSWLAELAPTAVVLSVLLAWFSWRRTSELKKEILLRKTAEALASAEKHNLQSIFDATPYGVILISMDKTILHANKAALAQMGYDGLHQVIGGTCHESLCPAEAGKCPILDLGQSLDRSEKILIKKDGTRIPILKTVVPLKFGGEDVLLEAFVDISEHKQAEAFIKDILESVDEAFVVVDRDYNILSANRAYCQQVKADQRDTVGAKCYRTSHGLDSPCHIHGEQCPVQEAFRTGKPYSALHIHKDSAGEEYYVESKAYPLRDSSDEVSAAIEIINDITEKLKLEEQLRHAQKMDAIGSLTGGVAHEFNNVITAIMGYSEFLQDELAPGSDLRKYADYIFSSARRASSLTEGLLTYSRKQITHMKPTDINKVISGMEGFLRTLAGARIKVRLDLSTSTITVVADASQLEQVVMNLTSNAFEAISAEGSLSISTAVTDVTSGRDLGLDAIPPGRYALITFRDSGAGMDKRTQEKIFEPFYTTKDVGQGTGLGLSIVYGIVKRHAGYITVNSEPQKGTAFRIYLPLSGKPAEADAPQAKAEPIGGSEGILLAEEDASVRDLMVHALGAAGYRVLVAGNGREAVEISRSNAGSIQLLVLGLSLPELGGLEACNLIKQECPEARVLFLSGYLPGDPHVSEIIDSGYELLYKPISPKGLLERIRTVLG